MSRKNRSSSRLVFSTDGGGLCRQCQRKLVDCVCGKAAPAAGDGIARIRRETKGRGGKAVPVTAGLAVSVDTGAGAQRIYAGVGFREVGSEVWVMRYPE